MMEDEKVPATAADDASIAQDGRPVKRVFEGVFEGSARVRRAPSGAKIAGAVEAKRPKRGAQRGHRRGENSQTDNSFADCHIGASITYDFLNCRGELLLPDGYAADMTETTRFFEEKIDRRVQVIQTYSGVMPDTVYRKCKLCVHRGVVDWDAFDSPKMH